MSELKKGSKVVITIETTIDELDDHRNAKMHYDQTDGAFNQTPFLYIKYGGQYSIELPTYAVPNTKINVQPVVAQKPEEA